MKIEIDGYKIASDGMCITLYRLGVFGDKSKQAGTESESIIGHYPNLEQALCRLLEEKISDSTASDVRGLRNDIFEAQKTILVATDRRRNA